VRNELTERANSDLMAVSTLRAEVTELLQELIRIDTVNPPGNETAAARAPARVPRVERRAVRALREGARAREPRRAHPGQRRRPRLALLSHTDTVLADARSGTATRGRATCTRVRSGDAAHST
jgi:acetylornithine deacetylase/succinyl-diaminopimelate desuccinylase-like protein